MVVIIRERFKMEKHRGMGIIWIRIRTMSMSGVGRKINHMVRVFRSLEMGRIIKATSKMELRKVTAIMYVNRVCIKETSKTGTSVVKAPLATRTAALIKVNGAKACSQATVSSPGQMETATKANTPRV